MNNTGTEKSKRSKGEEARQSVSVSEKKLRRMQSRQIKMRSAGIKAFLLAAVLLTASILGSKVTSDNEQMIRLALGQKNYTEGGEQGPQYFETDYSDPEELARDSSELGVRIQQEGIVLLRNENRSLPRSKGASVSVFGKDAVDPVYSRPDAAESSVSLKEALEQEKIRVNDKLWNFIDRGGKNNFSASVEKSMEEYAEAAVVVIGRTSGGQDLYEPAYSEAGEGEEPAVTGAAALQLTQEERELLTYVGEHFDRVIVVLNTENPMEMGFLEEFGIDGCFWTGSCIVWVLINAWSTDMREKWAPILQWHRPSRKGRQISRSEPSVSRGRLKAWILFRCCRSGLTWLSTGNCWRQNRERNCLRFCAQSPSGRKFGRFLEMTTGISGKSLRRCRRCWT